MRRFFDTNILVYSRDPDEAAKRTLARELIEEAIGQESFVLSTQVLVEFYATVVRRKLLGPARALELVRLWAAYDAVAHTPELVVRGVELHQAHSLSIWDGLIVQAALEARCDVLLSEDLQHGRRFGGLEVTNPFLATARKVKAPRPRRRDAPASSAGPRGSRDTRDRR